MLFTYICAKLKLRASKTPTSQSRQTLYANCVETKTQEQFLIFSTSIFKKHFAPILREIRKITIISFEKLCVKFIVENGRIENSLRKSIAYKL